MVNRYQEWVRKKAEKEARETFKPIRECLVRIHEETKKLNGEPEWMRKAGKATNGSS